jgi:hypothetical protein
MTHTPRAPTAQPPAANKRRPRPWRIIRRPIEAPPKSAEPTPERIRAQFRIRAARAVALVGRERISVKAACRAVCLVPEQAEKTVARLCDERGVARFRAARTFQLDPIKVQRAIFEIARGRGRCTVKAACCAVGFEGREARCAERVVAVLCDERGIARPKSRRILLPHWTKTCEPISAFVPSKTRVP